MLKNKKIIGFLGGVCLLLAILWVVNLQGKSAKDRPLGQVLNAIDKKYNVTLQYDSTLVKNRTVQNGKWQNASTVEQSLLSVLTPFNLMFQKQNGDTLAIKPFRTKGHRPAKEGQAKLAYLSHRYHDKASWEKRKKGLKTCMLKTLKLDSLSHTPASNLIITNERELNGYKVKNIAIETLPGLYVAGSLYQPVEPTGKIPVIITPNGHFNGGRYRADEQYRCATLARMGAMVFSYDLFAWGESRLQFDKKYHERPLTMAIQLLNGMRILDYLLSLKHADPDWVGMTGGSGGGTQTIYLPALDNRIDVSAPVVMLSSHFNGGCPGESGIPVHECEGGTNNVEIAAMVAPRPQLVISDGGDWTSKVPGIAYPFLQKIYGYYGKENNVQNVHIPDEGHSYGKTKRMAMYPFMAKQLNLNLDAVKDESGNIDESACVIEPDSALYAFGPHGEKLPANALKSFDNLKEVFNKVMNH